MKIRELIRYTKMLLKGRRARTMMICCLPLGAELFFRCAEAAVYCLMLYFGGMRPIWLFGGNAPVQLAITSASTIMRWLTAAPLTYAAAYRLCGLTGGRTDKRCGQFSRILLRKCTFKRSISAVLWTKAAGLLALVPSVFFGVTAYGLLNGTLYDTEAFIAANAVLLAILSFFMWIWLKLSFTAVPYLLVRYPKMTAFRAMIYSADFMRGRKNVLLRLLVIYLPQMVTIVGLPYALTKLMTAFSLSIDIFIKEDEYLEANRADSGIGAADNAGKVPHGEKRRVKAAADEA